MPWIQTASGTKFDLLDPTPDMICLADIAKALSQVCRFGGHTRAFYSVAQHSVIVSSLLRDADCDYATIRWGLMHDAAEAYIGDITGPLKHLLLAQNIHAIVEVESNILNAIGRRFNLDTGDWDKIKEADLSLLLSERNFLLGPPPVPWAIDESIAPTELEGIIPFTPVEAEQLFLSRALELHVTD